MITPYFEVLVSKGKGRGLFATMDIPKGTILEVAPTLTLHEEAVGQTLNRYVYDSIKKDYVVLALGYGSLFNHSSKPNVQYEMGIDKKLGSHPETITYFAIKNIKAGEELFINYGYDPMKV